MIRDPSFIYIATILPPILIGILIWKSDRFPEPGKFLVASFLLGVSIYLPLDLLIMITEDHLAPLLGLDMNAYSEYRKSGYKNPDSIFPAAEHAFQMFYYLQIIN